MPTPPFSQDRRDWLTEISGLFGAKKKNQTANKEVKTISKNRLDVKIPKACDSVTTISTFASGDHGPAKDQAMGDRPGRLG
jgi:hypothetical protein